MADPITRSHSYYSIPRDANRVPALFGVSTADGITPLPLEIDPSTGGVIVEATISPASLPSSFKAGQAAVGTSAAALPSNTLDVGVILQALSTNTVSIYIGTATVTTSTGFELQPGQATSIAVNNTNMIYTIAGSTSQGLCFVGS